MKMWITLPILFFTLLGCQTGAHNKFKSIEVGTEKGHVLSLLGNPERTYRKNDTDRWVYRLPDEQDSKNFSEKEIWFQNGRVVYLDGVTLPNKPKTPAKPSPSDFEPVN